MASFNNLTLTARGAEALLDAQAGITLTLSKIGMGSGVAAHSYTLTNLVDPKLMLDITEKKVVEATDEGTSSYLTVSARMSNKDVVEGFYWKEIGLFFEDSDGTDVLFAYASISGDEYDYIPAYSDERYVKHIKIDNIVTDTADITIKEHDDIEYVGHIDFEEYKEEIRVELDAIKAALAKLYSSSATYKVGDYCLYENKLYRCITAITTPEKFDFTKWKEVNLVDELIAVQNELAAHLKDTSNPHGVTASALKAITYGTDRTSIPKYANLNTYLTAGCYKCAQNEIAATLDNCPVNMAFTMNVLSGNGVYDKVNDKTQWQYLIQEIRTYEGAMYYRKVCTDISSASIVYDDWHFQLSDTHLKNDFTITEAGYAADARALKTLKANDDAIEADIAKKTAKKYSLTSYTLEKAIGYLVDTYYSGIDTFICVLANTSAGWYVIDGFAESTGVFNGTAKYIGTENTLYSVYRKAGADAVLKKTGNGLTLIDYTFNFYEGRISNTPIENNSRSGSSKLSLDVSDYDSLYIGSYTISGDSDHAAWTPDDHITVICTVDGVATTINTGGATIDVSGASNAVINVSFSSNGLSATYACWATVVISKITVE